MRTHPLLSSFLLLLLLLLPSEPTAFSFIQSKTLISLSHSLLSRVASAREERGDLAGAARACAIADKLRFLEGGYIYAFARDFAWNYSFRGGLPTVETVKVIKKAMYQAGTDLFEAVSEFSDMDSGTDRSRWVIRNYERLMKFAESLFRSLLRVFSKSGPLREEILVLQSEVVEGELLKDLIEVGAKDLDGLIYLVKEIFSPMDSAHSEF